MGVSLRTVLAVYLLELAYLVLLLYDSRRDAAQLASVVQHMVWERLT